MSVVVVVVAVAVVVIVAIVKHMCLEIALRIIEAVAACAETVTVYKKLFAFMSDKEQVNHCSTPMVTLANSRIANGKLVILPVYLRTVYIDSACLFTNMVTWSFLITAHMSAALAQLYLGAGSAVRSGAPEERGCHRSLTVQQDAIGDRHLAFTRRLKPSVFD
jgi:hypothetical protein